MEFSVSPVHAGTGQCSTVATPQRLNKASPRSNKQQWLVHWTFAQTKHSIRNILSPSDIMSWLVETSLGTPRYCLVGK